MINRVSGVTDVQSLGLLKDLHVYRTSLINPINTNGLSVNASSLDLPRILSTKMAQGTYLNAATADKPAPLGHLPEDRPDPGQRGLR